MGLGARCGTACRSAPDHRRLDDRPRQPHANYKTVHRSFRRWCVQEVLRQIRIAPLAEHRGDGARQADALIRALQQHQPAVGTQIAAVEAAFNDTATDPPKRDLPLATLWHPQSSVV